MQNVEKGYKKSQYCQNLLKRYKVFLFEIILCCLTRIYILLGRTASKTTFAKSAMRDLQRLVQNTSTNGLTFDLRLSIRFLECLSNIQRF